MTALALLLVFSVTSRVAVAQKDGEAQFVSIDPDWTTLKFSNKDDKPDCGLFISYLTTEGHEAAFAIRAAHLHHRALFGKFKFEEDGWLVITPSRIVFVVVEGDRSHAFDVPRTALEEKGGTRFKMYFVGIQINLKEKLAASDSREQKFVPFMIKDRKCKVDNQKPYSKLLERTVNDYAGAVAEFKQLIESLKGAGKIQPAPEFIVPPKGIGMVN